MTAPFSQQLEKSALAAVHDQRLRLGLAATAILTVWFAMHFPRLFLPDVSGQDYAAFFAAARAAATGLNGNLYDPVVFQDAVGAETTLLWLYPPPMLFFLAPFGLLTPGVMKLAFAFAGAGLVYGLFRRTGGGALFGVLGVLSPASFAALYVGQISAFFACLLAGGLASATKKPVLAGVCFGILTLKPTYGLMVIPFLIATRAWKAIAAAIATSVLMIVLSAIVFGFEMWRDFFASLFEGVHAAYYQSGGHPGRITLSDAIKAAGLPSPPALVLYGPLLAIATAGLFAIAKHAPRPLLIAYALVASAVVSPYFFVYDYIIVNVAVIIAAVYVKDMNMRASWLLLAVWFAPILPFIGGSTATPAIAWPIAAASLATLFTLARGPAPKFSLA
ncbi:MAG: glycosyltransferase family 87 protein [Pseudomonadota bacterium]